MRKRRSAALFTALAVVLLLGILELLAFAASRLVPGHIYYSPLTQAEMEAYRASRAKPNFSPTLGWVADPALVSPRGARVSPSAEGLEPRASVYGDSFAFASEVSDSEAWTDLLTRSLSGRVDNFGVPGYSTAQAVRRFLENEADRPEIAMLTLLSENIVRNVNQNYRLLYGPALALRPVAYPQGSGLAWELPPDVSELDASAYNASERGLLRHEYFWPDGSPLAKRSLGFPYLVTLPRAVLGNRRILYGLLDEVGVRRGAWYADFYDPAHESGAYETTLRLLEAFDKAARERASKRTLVLFLPRDRDIRYFLKTGTWGYEGFFRDAAARVPGFVNVGEYVARDFAASPPSFVDEYFSTGRWQGMGRDQAAGGGHYTAKGNAWLAGVVAEILEGKASPPAATGVR